MRPLSSLSVVNCCTGLLTGCTGRTILFTLKTTPPSTARHPDPLGTESTTSLGLTFLWWRVRRRSLWLAATRLQLSSTCVTPCWRCLPSCRWMVRGRTTPLAVAGLTTLARSPAVTCLPVVLDMWTGRWSLLAMATACRALATAIALASALACLRVAVRGGVRSVSVDNSRHVCATLPIKPGKACEMGKGAAPKSSQGPLGMCGPCTPVGASRRTR